MRGRARSYVVLRFLFYLLYCFDAGIFLIVAPWTGIWRKNFFIFVFPFLSPIYLSPFFRGAVSGVGVILFLLGISEIIYFRHHTDRKGL